MENLIKRAQKVYQENFRLETSFERAIFFSWGCTIGDCQFCYMSTQPRDKPPRESKRSIESILAEAILVKNLGWSTGFFSGGTGIFNPDELKVLIKNVSEILEEKIWLNIGPISKKILKIYTPYLKGVVASIETINPELHKKVCPSKPMEPYEKMFDAAKELGLKVGMTIILGLGETRTDFPLLKDYIKRHEISKIHMYSLVPHKNTIYENSPIPSKEEQAWWISNLRINFPKLDIQCGIWEDRVDRISYLLQAGANSISKFKALKLFNTPIAKEIEDQAKLANRKFRGTLTNIPNINWNKEVEKLSIDNNLKKKINDKLRQYLEVMKDKSKNSNNLINVTSSPSSRGS